MKRICEPELMEDGDQVLAYAQADFTEPHNEFIQHIKAWVKNPDFSGKALDLGCGPGDISRRFAEAFPLCEIDAVDGSQAMINCAISLTNTQNLTRLQYFQGRLPDEMLPRKHYDLIFSNSLLHHLPDPHILWQAISRYARAGTHIFVMDLLRPKSKAAALNIVDCYAKDAPEILRHDFFHSLLAAFTLDEIGQQLKTEDLPLTLEQVSDRHVFIHGTFS